MGGGVCSAVEGGPGKFMWEKNVCSADRLQTKHIIFWYALLFIASISLLAVCNSLTCSPCRDLGEHALCLPLRGRIRSSYCSKPGTSSKIQHSLLMEEDFIYFFMFFFFKGNTKKKSKNQKTELCFALHFRPTWCTNVQTGRFFLRLEALSSAS